jgi:hypothetical protein
MRYFRSVFSVTCLLLTIQVISCQEAYVSKKLTKVWESQDGLKTPESSCYNPADHIIYVSNLAQHPGGVNGPGYVSKMNDKGEIIDKEWVKGLKSPKGIGVTNGKLFVADVDEVWEISLKTGEVLKKYSNYLAKSMNDIAVDSEEKVYVTETKKNLILTVGKDSLEVFSASGQLASLNGVCDYGKEIILGSKGNLIAINKKTKEIRVLQYSTGYLDGIVAVSKDLIITSDFKGNIQLIRPGKSTEKILDTSPLKINAADLGFIFSKKILLVPTFSDNKVIAYKINY